MSNQFCTFYLDQQLFGVAVSEVQEVIRYQEMTPIPKSPAIVRGLINLRGQIVTAFDLRRQFEMEQRAAEQLPMNIVVRVPEGIVSLLVDEIGDVVEVEPESYEPPPDTLDPVAAELIRGVYKLDRQLLLIVDTTKAIQLRESTDGLVR